MPRILARRRGENRSELEFDIVKTPMVVSVNACQQQLKLSLNCLTYFFCSFMSSPHWYCVTKLQERKDGGCVEPPEQPVSTLCLPTKRD